MKVILFYEIIMQNECNNFKTHTEEMQIHLGKLLNLLHLNYPHNLSPSIRTIKVKILNGISNVNINTFSE